MINNKISSRIITKWLYMNQRYFKGEDNGENS